MSRVLGEVLTKVCPELAGQDSLSLLDVFYGSEILNRGLLLQALRAWRRVDPWGPSEILLAQRLADPHLLLNAVAEQYHGGFGKEDGDASLLGYVLGALLGPRVALIPGFYAQAGGFLTRVVGTKYTGRGDIVSSLRQGELAHLWREKDNRHDPNAIGVAVRRGDSLQNIGYVRRPIAAILARRMREGTVMAGSVAAVLGEGTDPNERVYVEVTTWDTSSSLDASEKLESHNRIARWPEDRLGGR